MKLTSETPIYIIENCLKKNKVIAKNKTKQEQKKNKNKAKNNSTQQPPLHHLPFGEDWEGQGREWEGQGMGGTGNGRGRGGEGEGEGKRQEKGTRQRYRRRVHPACCLASLPPTIHLTSSCSQSWRWVVCLSLPRLHLPDDVAPLGVCHYVSLALITSSLEPTK